MTLPAHDFDTAAHLLRDEWLQSVDIEIERLTAEKLRIIDETDARITTLMSSKESMRAWSDTIIGLPRIEPPEGDESVLRIASRFAPPKPRQLTKPLPPREASA